MKRDELDELLDAKLATFFGQVTKHMDDKIDEVLEEKFAQFFGQMTKHFDERLEARVGPLEAKIDRVQATLDADSKKVETDEQERMAISSQLDRHDSWIGQLAKSTNTKLVPEQ